MERSRIHNVHIRRSPHYSHIQHEKLGVGSEDERETCEDGDAQDGSNDVAEKRSRPRVPLAVVRLVGIYERVTCRDVERTRK